jgi:hypothetical protein
VLSTAVLSTIIVSHKCSYKLNYSFPSLDSINLNKVVPKKIEKMKTQIYIHVCMIGTWEKITNKLLNIVSENMTDYNINIIAVGETDKLSILKTMIGDHTVIRKHNVSAKNYERETLQVMHDDATDSTEKYNILYLHSKGITQHDISTTRNINDWIDFMLYFVVEMNKTCIDILNIADTCGVNLINDPSLHYSGNFWWATSTYIKRLNRKISSDYLAPEMWIGTKKSTSVTLWNTNFNHYYHPFPRKKYINKTFIPQIKYF